MSSLSASNRKLCKAQQVLKILSTVSIECTLMPVFKIRHLCLRMPNVHSTSFRIDSNHSENLISERLEDNLNRQTRIDHFKHPLSREIHTPLHFAAAVSPSSLFSHNLNARFPHELFLWMPVINFSNLTTGLSFYRAGKPGVECIICLRWLTCTSHERAVRVCLKPLCC